MIQLMEYITLTIAFMIFGYLLILSYHNIYGTESNNKIEYIGTSDWLNEVDKCVDLYQETEQNETLYYGCMNNLERDNVHYQ